jgi:hypothetical protein
MKNGSTFSTQWGSGKWKDANRVVECIACIIKRCETIHLASDEIWEELHIVQTTCGINNGGGVVITLTVCVVGLLIVGIRKSRR